MKKINSEHHSRQAQISRTTSETKVAISLSLDGELPSDAEPNTINTGIGFLDHMLDQVRKHGQFGLGVTINGDLNVDMHHSVEDCAIVLGQTVRRAIGEGRGINRFAQVAVPMDEALAEVALDISGRGMLVWNVSLTAERIGDFDCQLFEEWFRAFAANAAITLHVNVRYGRNAHHMIEACYKALALALRHATRISSHATIPSTKGTITL